jgi:hypothetical protein
MPWNALAQGQAAQGDVIQNPGQVSHSLFGQNDETIQSRTSERIQADRGGVQPDLGRDLDALHARQFKEMLRSIETRLTQGADIAPVTHAQHGGVAAPFAFVFHGTSA